MSAPIILKDSSSQLWLVTVDDSGLLHTATVLVGTVTPLFLNDPTEEASWQVGVTTLGELTTTSVTFNASYPVAQYMISASLASSWNLTVSLSGLLGTSYQGPPVNPSGLGDGNPISQYGSGMIGNPPIEVLSLGYYLNLLTSQYRNSPKLNKFLYALLKKYDDISNCQLQLDMAFDVDNAVGVQLDAVGLVEGITRVVPFQPTGGLSPILDDPTFRIYIKAKAAQNQWNGRIDGLQAIWQTLFPGGTIVIGDLQNMSANIFLIGTFTPIVQQLIQNGLIVPRPQGVLYNYIFTKLPAFGFGVNNAYVAGFGLGHFA
jgi:hypothetical protein